MDDEAAVAAAERVVARDFPGGEVVARKLLRRTDDGGAVVQFEVGHKGVGRRGPVMWVRVHVPPPGQDPAPEPEEAAEEIIDEFRDFIDHVKPEDFA